MLLIYFNIESESTYYYLSPFDSSKILGESNKFGDILIGLFLLDEFEYKLIPFSSSWFANFYYINRYKHFN